MSPPSRGRGLKPQEQVLRKTNTDVASFAGAWIETASAGKVFVRQPGRLLRGGVD